MPLSARTRSFGVRLTLLAIAAPAAASRTFPFAGRRAVADDGGMAQVPGYERCKHGEIAAWCGELECMARKGTSRPSVADSIRQCVSSHADLQALLEGHRMAGHYGREAHPAASVPLSEAMSALLGECFHCFPENIPADAEPCEVWSGGYGSADSCWNGSAVHTGGGKAWSITSTKQAVASALGRDARQATCAGRTRRRPQLALADHPGLIPGIARILIRSCGTSPGHGLFTTRNRVGEAGPWWCSPIRVLTRSVLIKKRPQRMRGRNGRRDILRSDESR